MPSIMRYLKFFSAVVLSLLFGAVSAMAQITISGVADKATYANSATFTITTQAGYSYNSTLNWNQTPTGVPVILSRPDFYELRVDATNQTTSAVTSRYVRFIVEASERVGTE